MPGLLADVNAEGHLNALLAVCRSQGWIDVWASLDVEVVRLQDIGLPRMVPDDVLWRTRQQKQLLLITSNRNQDGPSSLGKTIEREGTPDSLPVLTLADGERLSVDRAYCASAATRLMEILIDLDNARGSGRLWLP